METIKEFVAIHMGGDKEMEQRRIVWQRCPVCKRWGFMETPAGLQINNEVYYPTLGSRTHAVDSGTTDTVDATELGVEGVDLGYTKPYFAVD